GRERDGARALRRDLLASHVRHHGRLPPLLLAQELQDEPRLPDRARGARRERGAEGPAVVVRPAPPASPLLGRPRRHPLAARRLLLRAPGLGVRQALERDAARADPRLRALSRAALA